MKIPNLRLSADEIINQLSVQYQEISYIKLVQVTITNIGNLRNEYMPMYYNENDFIGLSFNANKNGIFIHVASSNKSIAILKGDELLLYFVSGKSILYKFTTGAIRGISYNMNIYMPSAQEMELFITDEIVYYKLIKKNGLSLESELTYFPDSSRIISRYDFNVILNYISSTISEEYLKLTNNNNRLMF